MSYIYLIIFSVVMSVLSNFFLKKATINVASIYDYININLLYGSLLLAIAFVAYYFAIAKGDISIVYPTITALSVILVVLMGYFFFDESLSIKHIIAVLFIIAGIILMYL